MMDTEQARAEALLAALDEAGALRNRPRMYDPAVAKAALAAVDAVDPVRVAARALTHFIEEEMAVYDDHDPKRLQYAQVPWDGIARFGELSDAVLAALGEAVDA